MLIKYHAVGLLAVAIITHAMHAAAQVPGYPDGIREASYRSDGDDSMQPTLIWFPVSEKPVPLLVALHTWSSDYRQTGGEVEYAKWCQQAGWAFIHPNFRGINKTPESLGSDLVVADIRSAVDFIKSETNIDVNRIYCVGVSGGGHASMLMAAREPELWAGVSAWCGISDIGVWHQQCDNGPFERYARFIESAVGGLPDSSQELRDDAWHRSPLKWIANTDRLPPLDLNHGINDGRDGSVPFTHSIRAWNAAVPKSAALSELAVESFYQTRQVPAEIEERNTAKPDALYGTHEPILRRTEGTIRLTIFDGGHEIVHEAALNWLAAQEKGRPVNWNAGRLIPFTVEADDEQNEPQSPITGNSIHHASLDPL